MGSVDSEIPPAEQDGQIATGDDAITIEVELGIDFTPDGEQGCKVGTVDQEVPVQITDHHFDVAEHGLDRDTIDGSLENRVCKGVEDSEADSNLLGGHDVISDPYRTEEPSTGRP